MSSSKQGEDNGANNWLALLQWSLKYQDGTAPSEKTEMSEEKRIFLENAMKEMTIDQPKRLEIIMGRINQYIHDTKLVVNEDKLSISEALGNNISNESDANEVCSEDELMNLLEECDDIIQDIDNAIALVTNYAGIDYLLVLLKHQYIAGDKEMTDEVCAIRCKAATIIGTLAQNNEKVQKYVYAHKSLFKGSSENPVPPTEELSLNPTIFIGNALDTLLLEYLRLIEVSKNSSNKDKGSIYKICSKILYAVGSFIPYDLCMGQLLHGNILQSEEKGETVKMVHMRYDISKILLHAVNSEYNPLVSRSIRFGRNILRGSTIVDPTVGVWAADMIAQIYIPTCLKYINCHFDPDSANAEEVFHDVDLFEASMQLLSAIVADATGVKRIVAMNVGTVSSPVVSVLSKAMKLRLELVKGGVEVEGVIYMDQLQVEISAIKLLLQALLPLVKGPTVSA